MTESINTEGLTQIGELNSRVLREAKTDEDYTNAWIAGAHQAFGDVIRFAEERIAAADPYDDTRALEELLTWATDKIKAVYGNPMRASG